MNEQLFERIERYLRQELSAEEAAAFERQLRTDEELAEQVAMQRLEHDAMEVLIETDLREEMKKWRAEDDTPPPGGGRRVVWLLGGLLLITAMAIAWRWEGKDLPVGEEKEQKEMQNPPSTTPPDQLPPADPPRVTPPTSPAEKEQIDRPPVAKTDEEPVDLNSAYLALATTTHRLPDDLNLKAGSSDSATPLDAGIAAFEAGNYELAIAEFAGISPEDGPAYHERAQEYLGQAYFQAEQYQSAAQVFDEMTGEQAFDEVRHYGEWYLLLSLLADDYVAHQTQIDQLLTQITAEKNHAYRGQALELRTAMQQLR